MNKVSNDTPVESSVHLPQELSLRKIDEED